MGYKMKGFSGFKKSPLKQNEKNKLSDEEIKASQRYPELGIPTDLDTVQARLYHVEKLYNQQRATGGDIDPEFEKSAKKLKRKKGHDKRGLWERLTTPPGRTEDFVPTAKEAARSLKRLVNKSKGLIKGAIKRGNELAKLKIKKLTNKKKKKQTTGVVSDKYAKYGTFPQQDIPVLKQTPKKKK